jgi:NAD(P)-dependent dehydrogenase (short-subunit alcohol dehydrogenase family)/uncharacterized OB-fold protein
MTTPIRKPRPKNPVLRTRAPTVPASMRARVTQGLTAAAARGVFALQRCEECQTFQYPPREVCANCLSSRLRWSEVDGNGELLARTTIRFGFELYFRERAPWPSGLVRLDCGATVIVGLHGDCAAAPTRVRVIARLDRAGQATLIGLPEKDTPDMADDSLLRETASDPKFRKILVTDAKSAVGAAIVEALVAAGADYVWAGAAELWKASTHLERLRGVSQVTIAPLDVTEETSVRELAGNIGGKVDIVINTAEYHRVGNLANSQGTEQARSEMETNYLGLLRLAQWFGPALRARAADGTTNATAWVNILSIYALSNFSAYSTFSASKAAAYSLAQSLRASLQPAGIRVINVFPGPIDNEWNQLLLPPKLSPAALAAAVVTALKRGTEDVYPGDVAQEWLARYLDNPKALERELAG